MSKITIIVMAFVFGTQLSAAKRDLVTGLEKIASDSDGRVGICVLEAKATKPVCVNGDQKFSLQSVMKLIVAAAVMDAVDQKKMKLEDIVNVRPENGSPGPQEFYDLVKSKGSLNTTVEDLIQRSVVDSDSTSVDILVERLGGISVVQDFLNRKKIDGIRLDRDERNLQAESMGLSWKAEYSDFKAFEAAVNKLPENKRDEAWKAYLSDPRDTATPLGMVGFLTSLNSGNLLSSSSTQKLLSIMAKTATGRDRLKAGIPKGWSIGHKTGTSPTWKGMTAATNDVGILTAPDGIQFAVAVFVAESKKSNSKRAAIISNTAELVAEIHQTKK